MFQLFFFFNDTATTEIYTLSLHDALPIYGQTFALVQVNALARRAQYHIAVNALLVPPLEVRSEEHTSELQSRQYLVCRLLLEKKKKRSTTYQLRAADTCSSAASLSPTIDT